MCGQTVELLTYCERSIGPTVMKFGGTSVGDVAAFQRAVKIVSSQIEKQPVVVVSAMTKDDRLSVSGIRNR